MQVQETEKRYCGDCTHFDGNAVSGKCLKDRNNTVYVDDISCENFVRSEVSLAIQNGLELHFCKCGCGWRTGKDYVEGHEPKRRSILDLIK